MPDPARRRTLAALAVAVVLALLGPVTLDAAGAPSDPAPAGGRDLLGPQTPPYPLTLPRPLDRRPNVVLVLLDDMRTDELPYLPRTTAYLAAHGTWFPHAISPHPQCCPARASLLSGQLTHNHGVQHNDGPRGGYQALFDRDHTVARWLADSGYATGFTGKFLNGYSRKWGRPAGWDVWDPLMGNPSRYTRFQFFDGDHYGRDTPDYIAGRIAERTVDTVERLARPGSPFFLFVNQTAPHKTHPDGGRDEGAFETPATPETRYAGILADQVAPSLAKPSLRRIGGWAGIRQDPRRIQQQFLGRIRSLRSADDAIMTTLQALRRTGELANTYVVVTSDNGFALGEHGFATKNVLMREILDVPLLIAGPGVRAGARSPRQVSLVDLPATFADVAGLDAARLPHSLDGLSLLPLLERRAPAAGAWRDTTLVQTGRRSVADRSRGWASRGVQTGRYLYVTHPIRRPGTPGFDRLYDRRLDPYEMRDVSERPGYAAVRAELLRRTRVLQRCAGVVDCNRRFGALPSPS